ncbi:MAG: hypothetical protein PVI97_05220 [Candidatus Thiodiazotropha sp.]|jgi:hypothetical protein
MIRSRYLLLWVLTACSGGDPTATDPLLIFEDAFENSLEEVDILAEGGTMVRGFDAWLKLSPKLTTLRPRNASDFSYHDCGEMATWFHEVTGDANLQQLHSSLICQASKEPRFKFDNGRWLLTDRSKGFIYYRIWKYNK